MSMKRSKQKSSSNGRDKGEIDPWSKPKGPEKTWEELTGGHDDGAFAPYALSERFAKGQLVTHPKFGKGAVVEADASRIEILFQDGKKKLGHGQAS